VWNLFQDLHNLDNLAIEHLVEHFKLLAYPVFTNWAYIPGQISKHIDVGVVGYHLSPSPRLIALTAMATNKYVPDRNR